ncbi:MAG TPA: diguanylate cyclase, partial [Paracoccaceae bacterium]|nr:diguanylate cyclase [Paracoccaceae bacterium]
PAAAMALVQSGPAEALPDAVVLDIDQPGTAGVALVAALRAHPPFGQRPLIALCADDTDDTALSALEAGVDDLFVRPVADAALQARLRNLLRARAALADMAGGTVSDLGSQEAQGMAEAPAGFDGPGQFVIVGPAEDTPFRLRRDVAPLLPMGLRTMSSEAALSDGRADAAEVAIVSAGPGQAEAALRLISDLRSRGIGRRAAICLMRPDSEAGADAIAFDLGASAVIDPADPPRAIAARLRRVMRRQRDDDRWRRIIRSHVQLAAVDPLTGLYNRRHGMRALGSIDAEARRAGDGYAVLIADLDRFKQVNDRYGHSAGDAVLTGAADRLRAQLRPGDLIARIGGEEFLVVLPSVDLPQARQIAERLCRAVADRPLRLPQGGGVTMTVSIGLAMSDPRTGEAGAGVQALIDAADRALVTAKATGRNQGTTGLTAA